MINSISQICADAMEWFVFKIGPIIFASMVFIGIPFFIYCLLKENNSPVFELKKDEWTCFKMREYQTTIYIKAGTVMVPSTSTHNECINWRKNK